MADHAGQPTKYKPEYCQMLIDHMAQGYSYEAFAGLIRVNRQTLLNWANEKHGSYQPDFAEAKEIASACSLYHWEKQAIDGLFGKEFISDEGKTIIRPLNTGVWALNMRNRFGWKDKIEVTTPQEGKPQRLIIDFGKDGEE